MDEVELFFFHPRQILSEEMRPVIKEIVFKTVFQPFSNMNCKKSLRNLKKKISELWLFKFTYSYVWLYCRAKCVFSDFSPKLHIHSPASTPTLTLSPWWYEWHYFHYNNVVTFSWPQTYKNHNCTFFHPNILNEGSVKISLLSSLAEIHVYWLKWKKIWALGRLLPFR